MNETNDGWQQQKQKREDKPSGSQAQENLKLPVQWNSHQRVLRNTRTHAYEGEHRYTLTATDTLSQCVDNYGDKCTQTKNEILLRRKKGSNNWMQHKMCDEIDAATRVVCALFFVIIYLMHSTLSCRVQIHNENETNQPTKQISKRKNWSDRMLFYYFYYVNESNLMKLTQCAAKSKIVNEKKSDGSQANHAVTNGTAVK